MSAQLLLWGLLPMALGAGVAIASLYGVLRRSSAFQVVAALTALLGVAWSESVLYRIVRGAWPTFLPHIVIALLVPLVLVQVWRARKRTFGGSSSHEHFTA